MNIHDKNAFAKAFHELDATNEPEAIRKALDDDAYREAMQSVSGQWYAIKDGELKPVEG